MTTANLCAFAGCVKPRHGRKELCQPHDQQVRRGRPLTPLRPTKKAEHCKYPGCPDAVLARGMCTAHYHQDRKGQPLTKTPKRITQDRDELGRKMCRSCQSWKAEDEFSPNTLTGDGLARYCKVCRLGVSIESRYNLAPGQYARMVDAQHGCCSLCGKEPEGHRLFVDHDHGCCDESGSCGECVRALLCRTCNTGLGMFLDDPTLLRAAASYIESHRY